MSAPFHKVLLFEIDLVCASGQVPDNTIKLFKVLKKSLLSLNTLTNFIEYEIFLR